MKVSEKVTPTREALTLLKILALTHKAVEAGKVSPADEAFARIRDRIRA
jgi:hypothetical protein